MRYASYLSEDFGQFAQYCRAQAGYYRNFPRKLRRELEVAAHAAGVVQIPRILLLKVVGGKPTYIDPNTNPSIKAILTEAAL